MSRYQILNNEMFEVAPNGSLQRVGNLPIGVNLSDGIKQLLPLKETVVEVKTVKTTKPRKKKLPLSKSPNE